MNPDQRLDLKDLSRLQGTNTRILSCILDAVNSGIIILDQRAEIAFLNSKAKQILGQDRRGFKGRHLSEIFMPEDRQVLVPNILKTVKKEREFEGEFMLRRMPAGSFLAFFSSYYWKQENEVSYVITFNDISRLKGVERILKKSERMVYLGRMLDDISHQIRNPVLAIGGFSRRLLNTRLEKPEYVSIILDESRRLEMLLDVLTHFIQLPKPKFSIESSGRIRDFVISYSQEIADQFDVELRIEDHDQNRDVLIVTDKVLFRQALEPVMINACESFLESNRKPRVILKLHSPATETGGIKIEISDSGPGIRPPLLPRVFHPFFSTKTGHLGMGLTFTRRIMEELEGDVEVESALNQGTIIMMRLPGDRRRSIRTTPV
jgi:PAS domain S-box-containing protein